MTEVFVVATQNKRKAAIEALSASVRQEASSFFSSLTYMVVSTLLLLFKPIGNLHIPLVKENSHKFQDPSAVLKNRKKLVLSKKGGKKRER